MDAFHRNTSYPAPPSPKSAGPFHAARYRAGCYARNRVEPLCRLSHHPTVSDHPPDMSERLPKAELPGGSRSERMLAAAALIDQALICLRSHPHEAEIRLRCALQALGVCRRTLIQPE